MATKLIVKFLFAFLIAMMLCSVVSISDNNATVNSINDTSFDVSLKLYLNNFKDILFTLIQILFSSIFIVLFIALVLWIIRKDNDMVILPFAIANKESENSGEAVRDLLIVELQRIRLINSGEYKGVKNEILKIPPEILTEKASIPNIGTIDVGSIKIPIRELMLTIKQFFGGSNHGQVITGYLEDCGSKMKLVAFIMGNKTCNKTCSWEVQAHKEVDAQIDSIDDFDMITPGNKKEILVSDLARELSFKIAYDISKDITSTTMSGFKYYTNALDNYQQYMLTQETKYLELASENCIRAVDVELNYKITLSLFFNLGIAYFSENMQDKAGKMFNKAIEIDPKNENAWNAKGITLAKLSRYDEAIKDYEKAININPKFSNAWNNKGKALSQQGKYDEAIKAYDKAIEIDPHYAVPWNDKGAALNSLKKYDDAIKALDEAIRLDLHYAVPWNNKGYALNKQEKYDDAIKALDKAIELDPNYAMPWINKGYALNKQEKYDEAIKVLDKAIELDRNYAVTWNNKGYALKALGRIAEADAAFAKAEELGYTG